SEWARGHWFTGFPWNLPAYNWSFSLSILQVLALIGPYFLTLLTLLLYGFATLCLFEVHKKAALIASLFMATLFACFQISGMVRLHTSPTEFTRAAVRVIQPNIPQAEKWDASTYDAQIVKMADLLAEETDFSKNETPDSLLTILPETAMNEEMVASPIGAESLTKAFKVIDKRPYPNFVYTGYLRSDIVPEGDDFKRVYFNSSLLLDSQRDIVAVFNKFHLVPFGEYMPLDEYLPISQFVKFSGFQAGSGLETLISPPLLPFGPLICYEVLFPGHVILPEKIGPRPEVLINITNDAWYGDAPGPYQHMLMARYRAIEEGVPVIRSANTGISLISDSYGRILAQEKLGNTAMIEGYIPKPYKGRTLYSQFGEFAYFLFLFISLATVLWCAFRKRG
ncbi:MAG: apolipoprotein N-acyltransferase, partial [Pseudobdellovibrionaceae bacterium]